jgi:hypothetical protein
LRTNELTQHQDNPKSDMKAREFDSLVPSLHLDRTWTSGRWTSILVGTAFDW